MESGKYTVLVNGMGNIGTTMALLLAHYQSDLELKTIWVCKRSIHPWNEEERNLLSEKGIMICSISPENGLPQWSEVIQQVDYIFETTANGVGMENLDLYQSLPNLKGASAQGSEKGFGKPFISGVNNEIILGTRFVNVVSCNTHGTAAILKTFCGNRLENLERGDVVVVRRSEDLGNHQRLVSGNVVARHLDEQIGTHHAIDVVDLFKTLNVDCPLTSSDITTPSQLMHSVRFHIELKTPLPQSPAECIAANRYIAQTRKFDSNVIFEMGRRYGFAGRIYSHAIIISDNLLVTDHSVKGWAFVPQEGNSILSTLHAFLLQLRFSNAQEIYERITTDLLRENW